MDEKAQRFSEECGPYAGMVYRHCLHMLSRPEEAEDAAQESMLRAFRAYDGYRGEGTATWLYRIAHNTCLDILRSARWKRETLPYDGLPETVDPSPTPEDVYQKRSRQEQLWQAVEQGFTGTVFVPASLAHDLDLGRLSALPGLCVVIIPD